MTIAIDCRWIDSSGIGVYLRECLPYFLETNNNYFLLGDSKKLSQYVSSRNNSSILDCSVKPFSIKELFFFPRKLLKVINTCDAYYSPYFNIPTSIKIPVYTTIHDIIFPDIPELTSPFGLKVRMWFYRRAFSKSKKIFTVSEFSKSRIEFYSKKRIPVIVTYSAIQKHYLAYKTDKVNKKNIILFIGNIKKHKGLGCLIEAFMLARSEGLAFQLVIIGSKDNFRTIDNEFLIKIDQLDPETVTFSGFISDIKLGEYLSSAALLVQPSLYEGFGLPPLEAMALGTRVLLSDIPVFREIYKNFPVVFFKAGDTEDLKTKIMEMLYNKEISSIELSDELLYKYNFGKTAGIIMGEIE